MNKVLLVNDFLSKPDKCADYISGLLSVQKNNFALNLGWEPSLHERADQSFVPAPILIHHLQEANSEYYQELKVDINSRLQDNAVDLEVQNIIFHVMTNNSCINWHSDTAGKRTGAVTIYLNKDWGYEKGGDFLYEIDKKIERVTPYFNLGIILPGRFPHRTTPVFGNHLRKSLQVWLKNT